MLKKINIFFSLVIFSIIFIGFKTVKAQDSQKFLKFNNLDSLAMDAYEKDDLEASLKYARKAIFTARQMGDSLKVAMSYYFFLSSPDIDEAIKYADSIIRTTRNSDDFIYPAFGYFKRSDLLIKNNRYEEALDDLLEAHRIANEKQNHEQLGVIQQRIAKLKSYTGDYQESLNMHKSYLISARKYLNISKKGKLNLLKAYYSLTRAFLLMNQVDSANIFLDSLKLKSKEYNINTGVAKQVYDLNAQINFQKGNFDKAYEYFYNESKLSKGLHLATHYYYLGKISVAKNNDDAAINFFKGMDSVLLIEKRLTSFTKDGLAELSGIYKRQEKPHEQLYTINRYLQIDSVEIASKRSLYPIIENKYDKPKLLDDKKRLEKLINKSDTRFHLVLILLLSVLILVVYLFLQKRKLNNKIKKLMSEGLVLEDKGNQESRDEIENLQDFEELDKMLKIFEDKKGFLDSDLTLVRLADLLETNTSYLSKYINIKTGNNFPTYLNNIRIKYAVEQLNKNMELDKYSLNGLASLFGYGNSNTFSRAFIKSTGVKPSIYRKSLAKRT